MTHPQPSRFTATPAEIAAWLIAAWLAEHSTEGVLLRFQQAIGGRAVAEAAKDQRMASAHRSVTGAPLPEYIRRGWQDAAELIDPDKGGGPYPSTLIRPPAPPGTGADTEFSATWQGGHALVIEYGDEELYGRCQCGKPLGKTTPDKPLDAFARPWERHVMTEARS